LQKQSAIGMPDHKTVGFGALAKSAIRAIEKPRFSTATREISGPSCYSLLERLISAIISSPPSFQRSLK
jgi:hypothetical protein